MRKVGWTVATIAVWLVATQPGRAAESIAFIRAGNLWLTNLTGSNQVQLSQSGHCSQPSWSPDGTYLVFSNAGDIWRLRLKDRDLRRLTTTGDCRQPAWRPRTNDVWFLRVPEPKYTPAREIPGQATMWRVGGDGGAPQKLLDFEKGDDQGRASWRADGGALIYELCRLRPPMMYLYSVGGASQSLEPLLPDTLYGPPAHRDPAWCPTDPNLVAFAGETRADKTAGLYLLDLAARHVRQVVGTRPMPPPTRRFEWPSWTPGAEGAASPFAFEVGDESFLWPTWAPEGKRLAFVHSLSFDIAKRSRGFQSLWTIDVSGRNLKLVAEDALQPAWSPALN